jgi:HicA toxin of bacterial toxin-antitoxin,
MVAVCCAKAATIPLYVSPEERKVTTVPRHREIKEYLVKKICRDLGVPER